MKRNALFVVLALVVLAAPAAMADNCYICRFSYATCYPASPTQNGWTQCESAEGVCTLDGSPCGPWAKASLTPLASEYQVATVERLDGPQQTPAEQTLVASAAAPSATR
ncbi:MAG TPA: hypothetical protein VF911_12840 [Thermoanaerobaculia bacterium]